MNKTIISIVCLCMSLILSNFYLTEVIKLKDKSTSLIEMSAKDKSFLDITKEEGSPLYTKFDIALAATIDNQSKKINISKNGSISSVEFINTQNVINFLSDIDKGKKYSMVMKYDDAETKIIPTFE